MGTPKAFTTTDFSLVTTLATLAVQLVNHQGQPAGKGECPEWREIETKLLDKLGISFAEAENKGLGQIAYGFADHPKRQVIIDSFRKARHSADEGGGMDIPDTFDLKCDKCGEFCRSDVYELLATFAGYLFANRKYLADRRSKVPAKLRAPKGEGHEIIDPRKL